MGNIIEFGKKAQDLKSIRDETVRQRKIDALKKIFQCTRCLLKCAKCGAQMDMDPNSNARTVAPYAFCRSCHEEYQEFKERQAGTLLHPRYYWHNDSWMQVWESWLEQQRCLDEYRQSKEFLQLLQEVEELLGNNP
ncbi:MAG TPA: hypothetical protein DCZ69_16355 [Syntrophobacteraceae bacterium]|nr:hypothetical protein [Syntrophobacteraceae bacterium]HBZ54742.1 hypothetical protein [Syntrophobacteraceae bacterium]